MWERGEIAGQQLPSGTVIVELPKEPVVVPRKVVVYTRVSNAENKANLDTQAERVISWVNAQG